MIVTFYSHSGGAGRSGAVANIAVLLCNVGKRVLALDLDVASSLRHYLHPLFTAPEPQTATLAAPLRIEGGFAREGGLIDYVGAGSIEHSASLDASTLREDLVSRGYDYVLIDSPGGTSALTDAITAALPDVLVVVYKLSPRSVEGGHDQARRAKRLAAGRDLAVLPVPARIDHNAGGTALLKLIRARQRFKGLLSGMSAHAQADYWRDVEIPFVPDYAFDESIVSMDDPSAPSETRRLRAAYVSLAARICGLSVEELGQEIPAATRASYQQRRTGSSDGTDTVCVVHTVGDRPWGEWIARQLAGIGLPVRRMTPGPDSAYDLSRADIVVLVLSAGMAASPHFDAIADAVALRIEQADPLVLGIGIGVDDSESPWPRLPLMEKISVTGHTSDRIHDELLGFFAPEVPRPRRNGSAAGADRLPTERPDNPISNLASAEGPFVGREQALEEIRDHFDGTGSPAGRLLVVGSSGVGKTRTAQEYAARFASRYEVVWRIAGDSRRSIERSLAELAAYAHLPERGDAAAVVREWLGKWGDRALLVVDDLRDAEALARLLPAGGDAHILITAREQVIDGVPVVRLEALPESDAAALLVQLISGIDPQTAAALAHRTGGHPLTVVLAASWVRSVARSVAEAANPGITDPLASAVAEFARQVETSGAEHGAQSAAPAGQNPPELLDLVVALIYQHLERVDWGAAARRLLETLAYLSPEGVWTGLIRSAPFLDDLRSVEPRLSDPITLDNVLFRLAESGLVHRVRSPRDLTGMHPRVGEAVRWALSASARADGIHERTVRLLAACAPVGVDEDTSNGADLYAELQRHVTVLDVASCPDHRVRGWLVNQVRYLWQRGGATGWSDASSLALALEAGWREALPDHDQDPEYLALRTQKANIHRSANEFAAAEEIDRLVLDRQRALLGVGHLRTLMTARSYAADLRQLGRFEDALIEESATLLGFRQALGDDHETTVIAASNLSISQFLAGNALGAVDTEQRVYERSLHLAQTHPEFPGWALAHLGAYLRELGRPQEAAARLAKAENDWDRLARTGRMPQDSLIVFETRANFAATRRRLGAADTGMAQSLLKEAREKFGEFHTCSLLCLAGAAAAHHWKSEHREAISLAEECLEGHKRIFGKAHPYTAVCAVNLAAYAMAGNQRDLAREMSVLGATLLADLLGPEHPWAAVAALNKAWIAAAFGGDDEARSEAQEALLQLEARRGPQSAIARYARGVFRNADGASLTTRVRAARCAHHFEIDLAFA